jgi:hypothetical protein
MIVTMTLAMTVGLGRPAGADQTASAAIVETKTVMITDPSHTPVGFVTFDSSFMAQVAAYLKGERVSVEYAGEFSCLKLDGVTELACTYHGQDFRRTRPGKNGPGLPLVTPKRRGDATAVDVDGSVPTFTGDDGLGTYEGTVIFTNLANRGRSGKAGGTAHLDLILTIDPDGTPDTGDEFDKKLGFQVHVHAVLAPAP